MNMPSSEAGFSLIETLVALAVIASMSAMLFGSISTHARAANRIAQKREAILIAHSLLAQASLSVGPEELPDRGRWQNLTWRFTRQSVGSGARDTAAGLQQLRIDIVDRTTGRRLVRVETLQLSQ